MPPPPSMQATAHWLGADPLARAWLIGAASLFVFLILAPALQMPGFAEDLGLVHDLADRVKQGETLQALAERWSGPLWGPGSLMWRPWGFTSLMIDAWLWGAIGENWHLTNLALHVATAALTGMLAFRLTGGSQLAAVVAASVFLLNPWIGETTFWLVGRFDGWATCFSMAALLSLTGKVPSLRGIALSLLLAAAALLSKESAMLLPVLVAIVLLAARQPWSARTMLGVVAAHGLLLALYLLIRQAILGSVSTAAYGVLGAHLLELPLAMLRHLGLLFPLGSWGGLMLIGLVLSCYLGLQRFWNARRQVLALIAWFLLVIAAAALFSATPTQHGEGLRHYHLGLPAVAILYGIAFAGARASHDFSPYLLGRWPLVVLSLGLLAGCIGFALTSLQWQRTAREIEHTAQAVSKIARHHFDDRGYGLFILPDHRGAVPALRNAQGGILYLAQRLDPRMPRRGLDYAVGMTDQQIDEWHRILAEPVVLRFTQRTDAPLRPTLFWCIHRGAPQALGHWPHEPLTSWRAEWKDKLSRSCPKLAASI